MTRIKAEVIGTERLLLVPQQVEHAREMAVVLSDPALHRFIGGEPATAEELASRYARMTAGPSDPAVSWCNWVVRLREGEEGCGQGKLTGTVQATISPAGPGTEPWLVADIAWVVGTATQGRGIATEAARGLVGWLERRTAVREIAAYVHPDHTASNAVARNAGLEPTDEWHDGEVRWLRGLLRPRETSAQRTTPSR
ncbi:GNAT family N-acetyltransferase [Streptomyces sp. NPDC058665]|uniref:GNAT family N-acetyltransferase n=1 Tax=Streptomyces sp. NPDC058665 TaxID=3346586 RepID=UPI00364CDA77